METPDHLQLATIGNFIDAAGKYIQGLEFFLLSFHSAEYEPHYVTESFNIIKIMPWLDANHVFINK